jgi:DNA-binding SARP family transcriptional activator/predicted ATPase
MSPTLHLTFLGGFNVALDAPPHRASLGAAAGQPTSVTGFISAKAQGLLAYLACVPRRHTRDALAALFWPEMPDSDAKTNLRQALANLKKLCDPWLLIERDAVAFNTAAECVLDVTEFERAARSPDPVVLSRAATLYGGSLLHGLTLKDAPEFDAWLAAERERLQQLVTAALGALARHLAANDDDSGILQALQRLVALDPLNEAAHRDLMLALARSGKRAAALAQFEACKRVLSNELGLEPEAQTRALRDRIRASEQRISMPEQVMPFIGREGDAATLISWLRDASCRLITISGMGGIGKTRLAAHIAARVGRRLLSGACFAPLETAESTAAVATALLKALALSPAPNLSAQTQVIGFLRDKEVLIVLDAVEHLIGSGTTLIAELLAAAPGVKLLVTSRQRLNLRAERLYVLEAMPHETAASPSAALFRQTARFAGGPAELPTLAVERICRRLAGHPLAIVLAASWSCIMPLADIEAELVRGFDRLSSPASDADERHRNVRVVFEQSWRLLSPAERLVLARLAVFSGGWTRPEAEAITGASQQILAALTQKSLIRQDANGRYSQHELLRRFALEQLQLLPDAGAATRETHSAYFLEQLALHEPELKDIRVRDAVNALEGSVDNLVDAWRAGLRAMTAVAAARMLRAMEALLVFLETTCRFNLGASLFGDAARATQAAPGLEELHGNMLVRHGWFLFRLGQFDEGNAQIAASMHIFEARGDRASMGYPLLFTGANQYGAGNLAEALRMFEASRDVYEAAGDDWSKCGSLNNIGQVLTALHDYARAEQTLLEGLAVAESISTPYQACHILHSLAELHRQRDDAAGAARYAERALTTAKDYMQPFVVINALRLLGDIAQQQGKPSLAQARWTEAAALAKSIGDNDTSEALLDQAAVVSDS